MSPSPKPCETNSFMAGSAWKNERFLLIRPISNYMILRVSVGQSEYYTIDPKHPYYSYRSGANFYKGTGLETFLGCSDA